MNQIGQFEVFIDDYKDLDSKGEEVYSEIATSLNAETIEQKYPVIFEWIKILIKTLTGLS